MFKLSSMKKIDQMFILALWWIFLLVTIQSVFAQQIPIARIELMPNLPQPYQMRNWKKVALGYDSLVFDFQLQGQYLPLIWWQNNTVNYPEHSSFGLHTVVGTTVPSSAEAINVLPAVIGASLVGIDKSNQNGNNWVLMCEEWFNRRPEENVYLNHPVASSGADWWYDTMPNVFFYQIYDLYPNTGDFAHQFVSVADRWLEAVNRMGGKTTPWHIPFMNYRGWHLANMTPNNSGVPEPEAAGAIAWLLYMANRETGEPKYRVGAELAMEFLNNWQTNPAYELQLAYGTYLAARMNAELGTCYNVEKFLNWCFEVGQLRQWGAIVGNWGGYDCSGLIGEVSGNDYAFLMNTFEQIGALVPLVRYDNRFARAIGKWVLNAANAARLFYPKFLPDENQDSEEWSKQYDPQSYIGHEALREEYFGKSPYATGDAIRGGWGQTNLSLYSSSHVGILGGIIDTTNVKGILKLDVLKTDYFHSSAFPTFLFYNPYTEDTTIVFDIGPGYYDVYDAVSNKFVLMGVSGTIQLTIPADNVILAVIVPSGGDVEYKLDKMWINGIVTDYHSGQMVNNYPPRIKSLATVSGRIVSGQIASFYCTAEDRDGDSLNYIWSVTGGQLDGEGKQIQWTAPRETGYYNVSVVVTDGKGGKDSSSIRIKVVEFINHPPVIEDLFAYPRKIDISGKSQLQCKATDPDGDSLTYIWMVTAGTIEPEMSNAHWIAPGIPGNYYIKCLVRDSHGGEASDSIIIVVRDFSSFQKGKLLAYYPLDGDATDHSGFEHHGVVNGATLTNDRLGSPEKAYWFDGYDDHIRIPNHDSLNCQTAISINLWIKVGKFYSREAFVISHGSWQNRWKISLIPSRRLRWTINTDQGIVDLDTETELQLDVWYNVTAFYDGADFEIYLNGELDNFKSWTGLIQKTSYDLTVGQMLPGNNSYNFNGAIDEIRIFDYGLSVHEIQELYQQATHIGKSNDFQKLQWFVLNQNYPNPFNASTTIQYYLPMKDHVILSVYDVMGRQLVNLVDDVQNAGWHSVQWEVVYLPSGVYYYQIKTSKFIQIKKMLLVR